MRLFFVTIALIVCAADVDAGCRGVRGFFRRHNHYQGCQSYQPSCGAGTCAPSPASACGPAAGATCFPQQHRLMPVPRLFNGNCANGRCGGQ